MCFNSKWFNSHQKATKYANNPLIAEKDIRVYKRLKTDNKKSGLTPYQYFLFEKGWEYSSKIVKEMRGFFSWRVEISQGLHSYSHFKAANANKCFGETIIMMYIPKGAKYYKNEYGEVVSNRWLITHEQIEEVINFVNK